MSTNRTAQIRRFEGLIAAGDLRLGMTRNEVKAVLGEPDAVGGISRRYRTPSCFRYGEVEVFFGSRVRDGLCRVFWEDADGEEWLNLLPADP